MSKIYGRCIHNKRKKSMQTALYGKIKEKKGEWLIGANKQNVLYLSIVGTKQKPRQKRKRRVGAQPRIINW